MISQNESHSKPILIELIQIPTQKYVNQISLLTKKELVKNYLTLLKKEEKNIVSVPKRITNFIFGS